MKSTKTLLTVVLSLTLVILISLAVAFILMLTDCSKERQATEYTVEEAYAEAQKVGYDGTLEEFIALIMPNGEEADDVVITNIEKTGTDGSTDTYTVYFADGSTATFTASDSTDSIEIASVVRTGTADGSDTYTITLSDGTTATFTVENGADGVDGVGISTIIINNDGELVVTLTDGAVLNLGSVKGTDGTNGADGVNITAVYYDSTGNLIIECSDGSYITAMEHTHDYEVIETVAPTCTALGWTISKCTECGYQSVTFTPSTGHTLVCGEEWSYCSDCGAIVLTTESDWQIEVISEEDRTARVVAYDGDLTELVVPSYVVLWSDTANTWLTYTVTEYGNGTSAVTLTTTGEGASASTLSSAAASSRKATATALASTTAVVTSVTIGNNVTTIAPYAFYNNTGIEKVIIEADVTKIDEYTFYGCTSLAEVTVSESYGIQSVGDYAFFGCTALTEFDFSRVMSLGNFAFSTSGLISVDLTGSMTNDSVIDTDACFSECISLTYVNLGNITDVPSSFLSTCTSLATIDNIENVQTTLESAFQGTKLSSVTMPNVVSLGSKTFYGCESLKSATFGSSLRYIDAYCFGNCSSLARITIPVEGRLSYDKYGSGIYILISSEYVNSMSNSTLVNYITKTYVGYNLQVY